MSLADVLPVVRSLPRSDRVQLVHLLIDELTNDDPELVALGRVPHPVWLPEPDPAGMAALQRLLDEARQDAP